ASGGTTKLSFEIARQRSGRGPSADLVAVVFDDRIGEQLLAHLLDDRAGLVGIAFFEIDLDVLALPNVADAGYSKALDGAFDGLALRIEHAVLEGNLDAGFHGTLESGDLAEWDWVSGTRCRKGRSTIP